MQERAVVKPVKIVTYSPKASRPVEYLGVVMAVNKKKKDLEALKIFLDDHQKNPGDFVMAISLCTHRDTLINKLESKANQQSSAYPAGYEIHIIDCDQSVSLMLSGKKDGAKVLHEYLQKLNAQDYEISDDQNVTSSYAAFYRSSKKLWNEIYINPPLSPAERYLSCDGVSDDSDDDIMNYRIS